nr:type IV toxin-antitoxin system AbiEi family antitoxin domain-containing protein [Candidatus Phycorickettsia trachydisci]
MKNTNPGRYLFTSKDLRPLFLNLSDNAFKTLLSRAVKSGCLTRICRNIYAYSYLIAQSSGLILFHVASLLRSNEFNYISLETVLSDAGIISQIPINQVFIMSSGRSSTISCCHFGTIEFIHTNRKPIEVMSKLNYDNNAKLWRANIELALEDMKRTHRSLDLIDWNVANEFI